MKLKPMLNRPGYKQGSLGWIWGPIEKKDKIFIEKFFDVKGTLLGYAWYFKRAMESSCVYVGLVNKLPTLKQVREEIRIIDLVASIY